MSSSGASGSVQTRKLERQQSDRDFGFARNPTEDHRIKKTSEMNTDSFILLDQIRRYYMFVYIRLHTVNSDLRMNFKDGYVNIVLAIITF
jgi:hypothetical protein